MVYRITMLYNTIQYNTIQYNVVLAWCERTLCVLFDLFNSICSIQFNLFNLFNSIVQFNSICDCL